MVLEFLLTPQNYLNEYLVQIIGAFLGAFFAFLFFLLGDYIKRKIDFKKEIKKEHAFLERYLYDVRQLIDYNAGLLPKIIEDYKNKTVNIMDFVYIPTRQDSTMKISDRLYINQLEIYFKELKGLNASLENINKWKNSIKDDLLDQSIEKQQRGKAVLNNLLNQLENYKKVFDYHLEKNDRIIAENITLLKKYKIWKYNREKIKIDFELREKLIANEIENLKNQEDNPIFKKHLTLLKKHGLYEEK